MRVQALTTSLCQTGELTGAIRIPDTVGHLVVTADLRASKVTCHVDVDAPREGRSTTRVNWLVRQLKNAPDSTRVEAFVARARGSAAAELLSVVRENPASLVVDPTKELRTFRVAATGGAGHQAWSRPRVVHRLGAPRRRRLLRRRPGVAAGVVRGPTEAAHDARRAPRGGRVRARSAGLDRLLLPGRHRDGERRSRSRSRSRSRGQHRDDVRCLCPGRLVSGALLRVGGELGETP